MKKKLIPIMLSVIFILSSFMTITVFAATPANQDGLEASIASSKSAYAANEDIELTLTVKNNNTYAVNGIKTSITLPNGITVKAGSLTQNKFSLSAGESKTNSPTVIKTVEAVPSHTPVDNTSNTGNTSNTSNTGNTCNTSNTNNTSNTDNTSNTSITNNTNNPQTGDNSNFVLWITVMFISAGSLVFLVIKNKKIKGKGVFSIFLCLAVAGAVGLPSTANAAGTGRSLVVTQNLTVDGKTVTVSAEISYDYVAYNKAVVTGGTGSNTYAQGETVTITANKPQSGYHFAGWKVVSGGVTLADDKDVTTTFTMPDKPVAVEANYEITTYTVTATSDKNGTISPKGSIIVNHGESKKFEFTPKEHYHVKDVTVDGTSVGAVAEYTFENITKDHTIAVTFGIDTFTITAVASENGKITPVGTTNVPYGGKQSFTITPDAGYYIYDVMADGRSIGTPDTYEFNDVSSTHTIAAVFAEKTSYTVTVNGGKASATTVKWGERVTIVADTPATDKEFKNWTVVSGSVTLADSTKSTTTFTMPQENVELTANYATTVEAASVEARKIRFTAIKPPENGTITVRAYHKGFSDKAVFYITKIIYRGSEVTYSWNDSFELCTINIGYYGDGSKEDLAIYWKATLDGTTSEQQEEHLLVQH